MNEITSQEAIFLAGRYPVQAMFESRPWLTPTEHWVECTECGAALIQSAQVTVNRSMTRHYVWHYPEHLAAARASRAVTP